MSTTPIIVPGFVHRRNEDGTFDSICQTCFLTIATESSELELSEHEKLHKSEEFAKERIAANRHRPRRVSEAGLG